MEAGEYIKALEWELRRLPREERREAVDYYREYMEEASREKEGEAYDPVREFGEPRELAAKIIQDSAGKVLETRPGTAKKSISAIWIVLLAILASPIALPVGLALVAVMFAVVVAVAAVIGAILVTGAVLLFFGFFGIVAGIGILFAHAPTGIAFLGICLACMGIGGFITIGFSYIGKFFLMGVARLFGKVISKRKGDGVYEKI